MDKKLTDNEIIKALKLCPKRNMNSECTQCPYFESDGICFEVLMADSLDLINRQKAEIERLKTNCLSMAQTMPNIAKAERAEAVKEFAERYERYLLSQLTTAPLDKKEWINFCLDELDNLKKEMVDKNND